MTLLYSCFSSSHLCQNSILARRFHKFFNIDENEECQFEVVRDKVVAEKNDESPAAVCFKKIDGCLCSPVLLPSDGGRSPENNIIWATRRTRSSEIENYVKSMKQKIDYNAVCLFAFQNLDATALFEWCPSSHVIAVVNHAETSLKFLGFRSNVNGAYFDMDEAINKLNRKDDYILQVMNRIPRAKKVCPARNLQLFCTDEDMRKEDTIDVKSWGQGHEGVVIAFSDGTRYKLKSDWYVTMARASKLGGSNNFLLFFLKMLREKKESPTVSEIPVDKLWLAALYDVDDVTAACISHLRHFRISSSESLDTCQLFLRFIRTVRKALKQLLKDLSSWAKDSFDIAQSVHVVSHFAYQHFGWPPDLVRASLQSYLHEGSGSDNNEFHSTAFEQYSQLMKNFLLTIAKDPCGGVEKLTRILGVKWHFGKDDIITNSSFLAQYHIPEDEVLPSSFANFVTCPSGHDAIRSHVLEKYALKKVAMLMGEKEPSSVYIPQTYRPDEGRIKGFWEQFQRYDVLDLRVDLQSMSKSGPNSHHGSREYALLLVQFGLGPNKKVNSTNQRKGKGSIEYPKGDIAGVLLPTQTHVSLAHFIEALSTSFKMQRMVRMQRRCVLLEGESLENVGGSKNQWVLGRPISSERFRQNDSHMNNLKSDVDWTLYCDLDGVLADFESGVQKVTGVPPNQQQPSKMWRKILGQSKFFFHLDFMPGADEMWAEICKLMQRLYGDNAFENLKILTGLPMKCKNQVHKDKRNWCAKNLFPIAGSHIDVITCQSKNKHEYSAPGHILIDDSVERKKDWAMHGGVIIHHVSNARTLYELRRTVGLLQEWIENEYSLVIPIDGNKFREGKVHDDRITYKWVSGDEIPFNASDHQFVGFDCEWNIHTSLVQLAVLSNEKKIEVYLIDMLNTGPHLLNFINNEICCNERIIKVGFALESDATQLQVQIKNAVDLQEVASDLMDCQHWNVKGSNIGLKEMISEILGITIHKEKDLQNCNWSARPLSEAQMKYAAGDSFYSLRLYLRIIKTIQSLTLDGSIESKIIPPKHIFPRRGGPMDRPKRPKKVAPTDDDDWIFPEGTVVNPIFSAAFLAPASKQELIRQFKPQHKNVAADHVTFCANINKGDLEQILPYVGSTCRIGVEKCNAAYITSSEESEFQVDCVRVTSMVLDDTKKNLMSMVSSGSPHITLSIGVNTPASASLDIIADMEKTASTEDNTEEIIYLRAVIGLVVTEKNDDNLLSGIGQKVRDRIDDFMSGKWVMGEQLRFAPGELSAIERSAIHLFAEKANLESRSEGNQTTRKLTLVKRRPVNIETETKYANERVFKCGNDAIDEKLESLKHKNEKKTKRITDKFRCTKLRYDLGFGTELVCSTFEDDVTTKFLSQDDQQLNEPNGGIFVKDGACTIKWYEDSQDAQEALKADVIILRGLPGSGKSTLCTTFNSSNIEICSADLYFENGSGLLKNREKKRLVAEGIDIYNHVFSVDKLNDAHQFCWEKYQKAIEDRLSGKIRQIIVDNTNSQKREYQKYWDGAVDYSLKVAIIEVACSGPSQVSVFCRRSRHNVPQRTCHAMFARWERDPRAFILDALTDEQGYMKPKPDDSSLKCDSRTITKTLPLPGMTFSDKTLSNWMSENHMFHFSKSRSDTTHLQMAVGTKSATFISVSKKMRNEFLLRYVDDNEPQYIHEMIGGDADRRFRMFLDIDFSFVRCITSDELKTIMMTAQQCTASSNEMVIATGISTEIIWEPKVVEEDNAHLKRTGLHLRLPQTYVNRDEALKFCENLATLLNDRIPLIDWTDAIDTEIYGPAGGLRMFLSHKVNKGNDQGRVYSIIATLLGHGKTGNGEIVLGTIPRDLAPTLEKVVELCSIHEYIF